MKTTKLIDFIEFCKNQHDIVCNQKYGKIHPYSFHLDMVYEQAKLFMNLVPSDEPHYSNIIAGIYGHDLIEDARITYNDIKEMYNKEVADIVYCCTEEKDETEKNDIVISSMKNSVLIGMRYSLSCVILLPTQNIPY